MTRVWTWVCVVAMAATAFGQGGSDRLTPETFKNLEFRTIGPSLTTGRISDIAVDPKNANVLVRGGQRRQPVEDREPRQHVDADLRQPTARTRSAPSSSIRRTRTSSGSATGENNNQRSVSYGDGIYKSTDAGADLDADGPRELRAHPEHPHRSARLERRLRERDWPAVERGRRPRPLQDDRRRQDVEGRPDHQRRHRRDRRGDGSEEPRRALCRGLSAAAGGRAARWRRSRERRSTRRPTAARSGRS